MTEYRGHQPTSTQRILNDTGARDRRDRRPIPCRARLVWEADGEEWIATIALRFDDRTGDVFVEVPDGRCSFIGAWLAREDVEF